MEVLVNVGGVYCIALVVFHLLFWRIFKWPEELPRLSSLNQAIMQVLNLSLTFVFVIFANLSIFHADELLHTGLGRSILGLISIFWLLRATQQVVFFRLKHWISWAFLVWFIIGALIYGVPLFLA